MCDHNEHAVVLVHNGLLPIHQPECPAAFSRVVYESLGEYDPNYTGGFAEDKRRPSSLRIATYTSSPAS